MVTFCFSQDDEVLILRMRVEFHQETSRVTMLHHLALRGSNSTATEVYLEEDQIISVNPNAPSEGVDWKLGRCQETCCRNLIACSKDLDEDLAM